MKIAFIFLFFIFSAATFAQTGSIQHAISILKSEGYVEETSQIRAIKDLTEHWDKPEVLETLISLIHPEQSVEIVKALVKCEDCYWKLTQRPAKRETVEALFKLTSFKSFEGEINDRINREISAEVRIFALNALGLLDYYQDEELKRQVFDHFYDLLYEFQLDNFTKDWYSAAIILMRLRQQKESSKLDFYLRNILENFSGAEIKKEALAILRQRNRSSKSSKLAVVHGLMSTRPRFLGKNAKVIHESDDSFSVRALEFLRIPTEPEYWSMPRNSPTDEGVVAMIETLFDRRLVKDESKKLLKIRKEFRTEDGSNRFEINFEAENENVLKSLEPLLARLRAAGVQDLNPATGVAETRMLLETGILGIKVPLRWGMRSPTLCSVLLKDLGTTHIWEKI